jgi:dTDP-4-dehydrorhamnose 3,5-epimerase
MHVIPTSFSGVFVLKPRRFEDWRGFFSESYNKKRLAEAGIAIDFVQDNLSLSEPVRTLRGLHFQREPFAQAKLVSVIQGAALDVVVDLRRSSPSFGQHIAIELSASEGNQLFIPVGFAHGFLTLEPNTLFVYKVSNYYSLEHYGGIRFDDAQIGIDWGCPPESIVTSDRDRDWPPFDPSTDYFA